MEPALALTHAAIRGNASLDGVLLSQFVQDGGELAPGVPAICAAANFSSSAVVQSLIAAGADVNVSYGREPFRGWTALHFAGLAGDAVAVSVAAALVAAGASTDARTADEMLPIDVAGSGAVAAALQKAGLPPCGEPGLYERSEAGLFLRMMSAIAALRPSEAAEALLSSATPRELMRWADPSGRSALHLAAFAGSPQLCAWCLDNGADVNARDLCGATPLRDTLSGYLPAPPVVRLLLDHGAAADEQDVRLAVKFGMPSVVTMLLAAGAPAPPGIPRSLASRVSTAPLQLGGPLYKRRAFLIESLLKHSVTALDAAVRSKGHDLTHALACAACFGSAEQLQLLLAKGAAVNARLEGVADTWNGATALHCAAACGVEPRAESIRKLLEAGADVNLELPCGLTALDIAQHHTVRDQLRAAGARNAPQEVRRGAAARAFLAVVNSVEALTREDDHTGFKKSVAVGGVHPSQPDLAGETALHHLAQKRAAAAAVWLVQAGADVNSRSWDGATPLHRAVAVGDAQMVELLLACGAEVVATDWLGFTAARLAAYTHADACLRAVTDFVVCKRSTEAEEAEGNRRQAPQRPSRPRRSRAVAERPRQQGRQDDPQTLALREAAAERAAAELLAEEDAKQRAHERKARRAKARQQRRRGLAPVTTIVDDDEDDTQQQGAEGDEAEDDGCELREPAWLTQLLEEFDVPPKDGRSFVETRVRAAPALAGQLAAMQRCRVCLEAPRGALLTPCSHAQFCSSCAQRVVGELSKCPVCAGAVTGWARVFL